MRYILFITVLLSSFCFGQKVVVSNAAHNLLYLKSNPVDISVEGLKCSQFTVKVDNGEIKGENCKFIIRPERTGIITISIFKKNKLIEKRIMNVVKSELIAEISMARDIVTGRLVIEGAKGINVDTKQGHIAFNYVLPIEYDVIMIRGEDVIFRKSYNGYVFNDELKNELQKTIENDLIIFTNMKIEFDKDYSEFRDKSYYLLNDIIIKRE